MLPRADYASAEQNDEDNKGFYWEVGSAYPIYLDNYYAEKYIKCGAKVECIPQDYHSDAFKIHQNSWNTEHSNFRVAKVKGAKNDSENYFFGFYGAGPENSCIVNLGSVEGDILNLGSTALTGLYTTQQVFSDVNNYPTFNQLVKLRFTNEDGSFVEAYATNADENALYILPYTHKMPGFYTGNENFDLKVSIPWFNSYGFGNGVESDQVGDTFNSATMFPYTALSKQSGFKANGYFSSYKSKRRASDIIFSQLINKDNKSIYIS